MTSEIVVDTLKESVVPFKSVVVVNCEVAVKCVVPLNTVVKGTGDVALSDKETGTVVGRVAVAGSAGFGPVTRASCS